ncbi:MmgE/PrpD family protein [Chloroflexota bacterium]
MDAAIPLARNIVNTKYEDMTPEVLDIAKKGVLDNLGNALGGSTVPGCKEVVELIKDWGGKEESTIFAYGGKIPAIHAAQVNSMMSEALTYSDTHDVTGQHPSIVVLPVCWAIAEQKGTTSGKEFLTAAILGVDLSCRMALAPKYTTDIYGDGWFNSVVFGYFAAAATAGKLLGFDEEIMLNAFGIAHPQASGAQQLSDELSILSTSCPSFAARGGICAAKMAEKGIKASHNSLEGNWGIYGIFYRGNYDRDALTADLGKRFEGINVSLKPYPCCRWTHQFIEATLALREEHAIKPEDVAEIITFVGENTRALVCEPLELKRNPDSNVAAQVNVPWTVATAILYGKVGLKDFTPEAIRNEVVLRMAQKVIPKLYESLNRFGQEPGIVEIRTSDGQVFSKRVEADSLYGSPKNPMSWDTVINKFKECASYAVKPVPSENLEKVIEMVQRLEEVDNVSSIVQLISP